MKTWHILFFPLVFCFFLVFSFYEFCLDVWFLLVSLGWFLFLCPARWSSSRNPWRKPEKP